MYDTIHTYIFTIYLPLTNEFLIFNIRLDGLAELLDAFLTIEDIFFVDNIVLNYKIYIKIIYIIKFKYTQYKIYTNKVILL